MSRLPIIVGMGGINAAGRSGDFHSYKRMVSKSLSQTEMASTWRDLAIRMGLLTPSDTLSDECIEQVIKGTLIRRIDAFDPDKVQVNQKISSKTAQTPVTFSIKKSKLPSQLPQHWQCQSGEGEEVLVTVDGKLDLLLPISAPMSVTSAGCIPHGIDISKLYNARHHPRGLQLTVYGANDLLNGLGLTWQQILQHIRPDQVAVYAGSALAQVDDCSLGGLVGSSLKGNRASSKMLPLSLAEMPADFINGYIINSVGCTGTNMGACASFLYNLRQGMMEIKSGRARVAIVGNAEAAVEPDLIEGFKAMGALAEDAQLRKLDNSEQTDNTRACRPFSTNAGFVIAESAQLVMLMDDELALTLGANILGSVAEVFVNADANKKSISAPGIGNYVTVAKAAALATAILGPDGLSATYVQAHGTGTPQNRTTESIILNEIAKTYGVSDWPVTAIKSYVGHSIGSAAGDQLCASLGVWQYGWIPGIKTIDHIASDVEDSNLSILMKDKYVGDKGEQIKGVIINAKGFGGNNASGLILSPQQTLAMLGKKYGEDMLNRYHQRNDVLQGEQAQVNSELMANKLDYHFGTAVMDDSSVTISQSQIKLSGFNQAIDLPDGADFAEYL